MNKNHPIRNPFSHLDMLGEGEEFFVGIRVDDQVLKNIEKYHLEKEKYCIPLPLGLYTYRNQFGEYIIDKDLPLELRHFYSRYHMKDWQDNWHNGFCWRHRYCYGRYFIEPTSLPVIYTEACVCSRPLVNKACNENEIRVYMNMFREMFGSFEIFDANKETFILRKSSMKMVDWEILPPGKQVFDKIQQIIETVENAEYVPVVTRRNRAVEQLGPDSPIIGKNGFYGYIIYPFSRLNLYIFESLRRGNATYIFRGNWEECSKMTKREILEGKLEDKRLIHHKGWEEELKAYFEEVSSER